MMQHSLPVILDRRQSTQVILHYCEDYAEQEGANNDEVMFAPFALRLSYLVGHRLDHGYLFDVVAALVNLHEAQSGTDPFTGQPSTKEQIDAYDDAVNFRVRELLDNATVTNYAVWGEAA